MSVRKAQNRVRKEYGIGKGKLHKRMSRNHTTLSTLAYQAQWGDAWTRKFDDETIQEMHALVDDLASDSIIATAYREAERAARGEKTERVSPKGHRFDASAGPVEPIPLTSRPRPSSQGAHRGE